LVQVRERTFPDRPRRQAAEVEVHQLRPAHDDRFRELLQPVLTAAGRDCDSLPHPIGMVFPGVEQHRMRDGVRAGLRPG